MKTTGLTGLVLLGLAVLAGCAKIDGGDTGQGLSGLSIEKNRMPVSNTGFTLIEGRSVVLTAVFTPAGSSGSVHWQSSAKGIVTLGGEHGGNVTVTGKNGGSTIIKALARNSYNDVYLEVNIPVIVTATSFFKWNYAEDGWTALAADSNGTVNGITVRAAGPAIAADAGGFILDGTGAAGPRFIIGSGMTVNTNSPFTGDPVYDVSGAFDFTEIGGVSVSRVRLSVDYELLGTGGNSGKYLRLQINNNTTAADNASTVTNWKVAELAIPPVLPADRKGTLSGVFDLTTQQVDASKAAGVPGADNDAKWATLMGNSFAALTLSGSSGTVRITAIRIENAD